MAKPNKNETVSNPFELAEMAPQVPESIPASEGSKAITLTEIYSRFSEAKRDDIKARNSIFRASLSLASGYRVFGIASDKKLKGDIRNHLIKNVGTPKGTVNLSMRIAGLACKHDDFSNCVSVSDFEEKCVALGISTQSDLLAHLAPPKAKVEQEPVAALVKYAEKLAQTSSLSSEEIVNAALILIRTRNEAAPDVKAA